ncbi:hypothetical protein Tco_0968605 [Tanacetum coccineum]
MVSFEHVDSEDSTVTYTEIASPYEDLSDIGLPGAEGPIFQDPPFQITWTGPEEASEQAPPLTYLCPFVPELCLPEFLLEDYVLRLREQPFCCCLTLYGVTGFILSSRPEEVTEEDDEGAVAYSADQDPYLAYRVTARMSIRPQAPAPYPSPLTTDSITTPNSPKHVEGSWDPELLGLDERCTPFLFLRLRRRRICLPLRKRPCRTTPGPGYEVGESSVAGTARQVGPAIARADLYGFADMLDVVPGCHTSRELGYGITDTWDDLVGAIQEIAPTTLEGVNQRVTELVTTIDQEDEIIYSQLDDARYDRALLRARVNMLYRDRPFHRHIALLIEEEARLSRAAWARLMDACDQVHSEGISLRTTVMAQQFEITELQAADLKSLKTQMIELQRQQGPAKDPVEPELPEEASSSS